MRPRHPSPPKPRSCGTCRLCLALDSCPDLKKPEAIGCLWAQGIWGSDLSTRPDQTRVVPWIMAPPCRPGDILLHLDPKYPTGFRKTATRRLVLVAQRQGRTVFLQIGEERKYVRREAA